MTTKNDSETLNIVLKQNVNALTADMETPISLYYSTSLDKHSLLLESAEVDGKWGRYSLIATDFLLEASCENGKLKLSINDERLKLLKKLEGEDFIDGLRKLMKSINIEQPKNYQFPPITRALYGYFGFEMAAIFDPKLEENIKVSDAQCTLVLPKTLFLFDHFYNKLYQISIGAHNNIEQICNRSDHIEIKNVKTDDIIASPNEEGFIQNVKHIKGMLAQGEAIQVVPSCRFSIPFNSDPFLLYRKLRLLNPSPYMVYMNLPSLTLICSSPEVMVSCTKNKLGLFPIAGTRKRGATDLEDQELAQELLSDPKERSEHIMLVDLGRNDLGRIAAPNSIVVEKLMQVERFSHVMHLTSHITAYLEKSLDAIDILKATFPAGTVSGAPKIRAIQIITETEKSPRGPYAGAVGWLGLDKDSVNLNTGITIRSMWIKDGKLYWQAGCGIVHDSNPKSEWDEVYSKSAIMRAVLGNRGE